MKRFLLLLLILSNFGKAEMTRDDNDILHDSLTNLAWDDTGDNKSTINWHKALQYCTSLTLGGHTDWRVPNINELMSVTNYNAANRLWQKDFKIYIAAGHWSSTTLYKQENRAWTIDFNTAQTVNSSKLQVFRVRCVRTD